MIRGIWKLATLDLAIWIRSPWAIAAAVIPPLAMALFLWVLAVYVHGEPVALVVESHGRYANRMAAIIREEAFSGVAVTETDRAQAQRLLQSQKVAAIVVIPRGFDEAVAKRRPLLPFIEATQDTRFEKESPQGRAAGNPQQRRRRHRGRHPASRRPGGRALRRLRHRHSRLRGRARHG